MKYIVTTNFQYSLKTNNIYFSFFVLKIDVENVSIKNIFFILPKLSKVAKNIITVWKTN